MRRVTRRLCTLAILTTVWLLVSAAPASAHCHGSVTYGPGGTGDCGKAALWGTLIAAAAWLGAAALNVLALALDYYREPLFRKHLEGHFGRYRPPSERYRRTGDHRLERHLPQHRRRSMYRKMLNEKWEDMYRRGDMAGSGRHDDVSKIGDHVGKLAEAAIKLAFRKEPPDLIGGIAEHGSRLATLGWPVAQVGWRMVNDLVIRIRLKMGLLW